MSCCFESSTPLKTLIDFRMILMKLGTGHPLTFSHSIGINANYMIVSRRKIVSTPSSPLLLEGHSLERVEMFKYLGVLLSHDLSWGEHVQAICSKARKILGLLYRRFYNNAPSSTLLQLYTSLVRPHLDYALAIWFPYLSKDKMELEHVQKFAWRMATGLWDRSYQDLLELVAWPSNTWISKAGNSALSTTTLQDYLQIVPACYFNPEHFHRKHFPKSPCTTQPCFKSSFC